MPIIVLVSPKGGVGKTTSALVLGTSLAHQGASVTMIDADPNRPLKAWSEGQPKPGISVISDVDEDSIQDRIDEAATQTAFVIVDLEGTAGKIALLAVACADLVLIPMQASQLDAAQASKALKVVRQQERMSGRHVPHAILWTRTSAAIRSRTRAALADDLRGIGVPMLSVELCEREAFRAMFSFRLTVYEMDGEVSNVARARDNALALTDEVLSMIREQQQPAQARGQRA
ncbi:AAA family ATPase [Paraburkholderia sp. GAS32]|uniref:AAA family ATPase n=1 Tax=Paraburkholderia sp. GAS32 TaxID=3035129 RepID=UPI003D23806D